MDEQDRQDGVNVSFESTIIGGFCATLLVEDPSQEPNRSHPVYPVYPCLSSLRRIAFYLMNCACNDWKSRSQFAK
jgi:hypothetical protein